MKKFQFTFTLPAIASHIAGFCHSLTEGEYASIILATAQMSVTMKDGSALVSFFGDMTEESYSMLSTYLSSFSDAAQAYSEEHRIPAGRCTFTFFAIGPAADEQPR